LSDENEKILLASHYIWEGELATFARHYDVALPQKVRMLPQPIVLFSTTRNLLYGYYPVVT
jgi:hypothetical protein